MLLHPFYAHLSSSDCTENKQGRHDATNVQWLFSNSLFDLVAADDLYQSKEVWLCSGGVGLFAVYINMLCSIS